MSFVLASSFAHVLLASAAVVPLASVTPPCTLFFRMLLPDYSKTNLLQSSCNLDTTQWGQGYSMQLEAGVHKGTAVQQQERGVSTQHAWEA